MSLSCSKFFQTSGLSSFFFWFFRIRIAVSKCNFGLLVGFHQPGKHCWSLFALEYSTHWHSIRSRNYSCHHLSSPGSKDQRLKGMSKIRGMSSHKGASLNYVDKKGGHPWAGERLGFEVDVEEKDLLKWPYGFKMSYSSQIEFFYMGQKRK